MWLLSYIAKPIIDYNSVCKRFVIARFLGFCLGLGGMMSQCKCLRFYHFDWRSGSAVVVLFFMADMCCKIILQYRNYGLYSQMVYEFKNKL